MSKDRDFCKKYQSERIKYNINAVSRRIIGDNIFKQHYNRKVASGEEGNELIREAILKGEPFMAGRFGGNELRTISDILYERAGGKNGGLSDRTRFKITNQAGLFPDDRKIIEGMVDLYLESCKEVDILGVWDMFLQPEVVDRYVSAAVLTELRAIEPYYHERPWSSALEGKKVLVIHPFASTIEMQYEKRSQLFEKEILPEFTLNTVKAVQTIAGQKDDRFKDWFEALDYMYNEAMKQDFDIAILGCGAYGFPLAARIKKAGKMVIHMGGSLQILFGIKGSRWDNHDFIGKLYNDAWVRPSDVEKVAGSNVVEKSCYW